MRYTDGGSVNNSAPLAVLCARYHSAISMHARFSLPSVIPTSSPFALQARGERLRQIVQPAGIVALELQVGEANAHGPPSSLSDSA